MNCDLTDNLKEWRNNLTPKGQEEVIQELNWYVERKEQLKGSAEDEPST